MSLYEKNIAARTTHAEKIEEERKKKAPENPRDYLEQWFDGIVESLESNDEKWQEFYSKIDADYDVKRNNFCHELLNVGFPLRDSTDLFRKFNGPAEAPRLSTGSVIANIRANSSRFYHRFSVDHPVLKNCSIKMEARQDVVNFALLLFPGAWHDVGYKLVLNTNDPKPSSGCSIM